MQTGYYSSAAGMVAQFNRLDTISNNLANVKQINVATHNDRFEVIPSYTPKGNLTSTSPGSMGADN